MARNAFGVMTGGPRSNLTAEDLDYIYGRDGARAVGGNYGVTSSPLPDITPRSSRPQLRGTIDETAPVLRGTLGPQDSPRGGRAIQTSSGAPLPAGRGFAQAVYERALGTGLTDTQARLVASQAALESRNGQSGLARRDNNFFGIKAGSSWKGATGTWGTGEQAADGSRYREQARFRKYNSPEESFADYVGLVKRRWPEAFAADNIRDATAGLRFGQQGGYATDQAYGGKIASIARGLKPPGQPGPYNPDGIRPPADIPSPMGGAVQPISQQRSNMAPPEVMQNRAPTNDLVDRHQLQGPPQSYVQQGPYQPPPQQMRTQDFFQPLQQPMQPQQPAFNAFGGGDQGGGGGGFLDTLFGGGGGDFWSM